MRVGLTFTQMKLGRAKQHLDELQREVLSYAKDRAYVVTKRDDEQKGLHVVKIEQSAMPDPIGILVGEFAFCLRSSLDHLAWQLALLSCDQPGRDSSFPIYSAKPSPKDDSFQNKVKNIAPEAVAIIESLQPYHQGNVKDDCLWQLNRLCNTDKHQVIAISYVEFQVRIDGVSKARRHDSDHAIEIAVPLTEKQTFELRVEVPGIVFGEPIETTDGHSDFEISMDQLGRIYEHVRHKVVPQFEKFFT